MQTIIYSLQDVLLKGLPCYCCLLVSLIVLEWYAWPFVVLWTVCGVRRCHYYDHRIGQDSFIFATINAFLHRGKLLKLSNTIWKTEASLESTAKPTLVTFVRVAAFTILLGTGFWRLRQYRASRENRNSGFPFPLTFTKITLPSHAKPLIFPCRTTHARVFPTKHAFGYSYLLYGIPIVPKFISPDGTRYGVLNDSKKGNWWLQVRAEDYLERGYGEIGFFEKLKMTLKAHGVQESEWSYAYLITAPRFLGYSFNPVSFWYIYDEMHELKKMILEVNNTFGERRLYVLHGSGPGKSPEISSSATTVSEKLHSSKKRFVDNWQKDFHVSPFNSRKGGYSLKALDPFSSHDDESAEIDNTITLTSSKEHAKVVARVYSTGPPLDPANLGFLGTARFVGGWFWVGLLTSPRILKEAYKLYFKRGLYVWLRPEVLPSSIGRAPTSSEIALEKVFVSYLYHLVHRSGVQFNITLHTGIPHRPIESIASTHIQGRKINPKIFEIKVLNPSFYTRFVHYAHASEAFDREGLFTEDKSRTLAVSHPEFLPLLLSNAKSDTEEMDGKLERSYFAKKRWFLLRRLRCPPAEPAYSGIQSSSNVRVSDIRAQPLSDLDNFMLKPYSSTDAGSYRRKVTKVFLATRFTFGFVEVIDAFDFLLRACLCYLGFKILASWSQEADQYGLGRTLYMFPNSDAGELRGAHTEWWWLLRSALCMCACHFYGLMKGYR